MVNERGGNMMIDVTKLDDLSLNKRLHLMEALIETFTKNECAFESPAWHIDVLNHRQQELNAPENWRSLDDIKQSFSDD